MLCVGDKVEIIGGPFKGCSGYIVHKFNGKMYGVAGAFSNRIIAIYPKHVKVLEKSVWRD